MYEEPYGAPCGRKIEIPTMQDFKFQISTLRLPRTSARCSSPAVYCLLPALLCLLLTAYCLLPSACSPLPAAYSRTFAWSKQKTGTFAWLHTVYFVDEQRGWAAGGKGALLATTDGGLSWEVRRRPTEDALEDIFFTDELTGWIVCERSVYMPMAKDESISYLLKTRDGGTSWSRVEVTRGPDVDVKLARVRFADRDHGWVFGEMGALFVTTDGGGSWTRQRVPTRHLLLGATFIDAQRGWLVGAGSTLLQTSDGGATWRAGRIEAAPLSIPSDARAQSSATALQSSATSRQSSVTSTRSSVTSMQSPGTPTQSPGTPTQTPVATAQGGAARDGAQSQEASVLPESAVRLNAVSFADARRGWAVGAGGAVLATLDGGRTWRAQSSGTRSDLFDVKFFDEREGWAVGGDGVAIHTADGGATWSAEPTGTPHTLERLFFLGRARGWAVGFGGTVVAFKG
jgi:photosystem II stability/assembly factor-like uncharacterized protein